jgi:hypothetical protein
MGWMMATAAKSGKSVVVRKSASESMAGSFLSPTSWDEKSMPKGKLSQRHKALIDAGQESGLLTRKDSRISGRVSGKLVQAAREKTGITSDTELIELALASLALEDNFGKVLSQNWGVLDADTDFGV